MSEFFNTVYNELSSNESVWFIIFHLIAWLLGLLTGYFIWGRQVKRLREHAAALQDRINLLEGKNNELKSEVETKETFIGALSGELDIEKEKNKLLENEKGDLHSELLLLKAARGEQDELILQLNNEKEKLDAQLSAEAMSYKSSISGLNADLDARTANLGDLQAQIGKLEADISAKSGTIGNLEAKIGELEGANAQLNTDLNAKVGNLGDLQVGMGKLEADIAAKATTISDLEAKIGELEGANAQLNTDLNAKVGNLGDLQVGMGKLEADISAKATTISDLEAKIGELEGVNAQLNTDLNAKVGSLGDLEMKLGQLESANTKLNADLSASIGNAGDLEAKIGNLESLNSGLQGDLDATIGDISKLKTQIGDLEADVSAKATAISDLTAKVGDLEGINGRLNADLTAKGNEVSSLQSKIDDLNVQVTSLEDEKNLVMSRSVAAKPAKLTKEEKAAISLQAASEVKDLIGSHIPSATAADKDDLKIISGVGPFIETKLNNLGIWTYEQISYFDKRMIDKVTDAIQFFPGRIERDKWIPQAKGLSTRDMSASAKARSAIEGILGTHIPMATAADKDNLKVISGVGPFIEEKLNDLGIYTYEQVSLFDKDFIEKVTDAIEFFPGRIERDNWVNQAKALFEAK